MSSEPDIGTAAPGQLGRGLTFALVSATSFGLSGAVGRALFDAGWTPGASVLVRIAIAAAVLLIPGTTAMSGRWSVLRRNTPVIVVYGVLAVAGAQLCYFFAVTYLQVGVALLIEYLAPVAVVMWMWLVHGQRPGRATVLGAAVAAAGLVLLLDLLGGADISVLGVAWATGAMVGAATFFIVSADVKLGLPPITLAAGGLTVGGLALAFAGAVGILPMAANRNDVEFAVATVPWWAPVATLGLVTAALAYVSGIAAGRRLGSRLSSFVALIEVIAAVGFARILLGQVPTTTQLAGAGLVLVGVVIVKVGEPGVADDPAGAPIVGG